MAEALQHTLGMAQLAGEWAQRLRGSGTGPGHDALIVVGGPAALLGQRFELARSAGRIELTRGGGEASTAARDPTAPILLDSAYVSSPHAALEATPSGWSVVDLQSANHTYVGTVRALRQQLVYGDELRLGDVVLLFAPADPGSLPSHVLDAGSGLLSARVLLAEAARLAGQPAPGAALCLLLVRAPGLGAQEGAAAEEGAAAQRIGAALLRLLPASSLVGRLRSELFAAVWQGDPAALRPQAERTVAGLAGLTPGPAAPHGVIAAAASGAQPFQALLAPALAALEARLSGAPAVLEADLSEARPLLVDDALLAALQARPELTVVVAGLEDEDRVRHQLGHERLAAWRWQLRRLARHASEGALAGLLEERALLLGTSGEEAARLAGSLRESFGAALPGLEAPRLATALLGPEAWS